MVWLAVPAGFAYGLSAALSARSVRRDPGRSAPPPKDVGAWASLAFAVLAVPAMLAAAAAGVVRDGPFVGPATYVGAAGVAGIGLDALMRVLGGLVPVGVQRWSRYVFPIGFLAFHLWVVALSVSILVGGMAPAGLGWLGIAAIGGFVAGIVASVRMPEDRWGIGWAWFVASFGPQAGVAAWMVWLGLSL